MKTTAFWDVEPCSFVEADRRFRGSYCLHHQVYFHETTLRDIPESCHLHKTVYFFFILNNTTSSTAEIICNRKAKRGRGQWNLYFVRCYPSICPKRPKMYAENPLSGQLPLVPSFETRPSTYKAGATATLNQTSYSFCFVSGTTSLDSRPERRLHWPHLFVAFRHVNPGTFLEKDLPSSSFQIHYL
jgi:hypothetical protein